MQATDREVDDDPIEDHHDSADQGEPGGPEGFVFDLHSGCSVVETLGNETPYGGR